ncbi:MAG: hypothetical protein V3T70_03040 [Phycisphaerae bacterium]
MRLWTWQGFGHSLISGRVIHNQSQCWNIPGYARATELLYQSLGRDQLIWCYSQREEHCIFSIRTGKELEWELEVPSSEMVAIYRSAVWTRIIYSTLPQDEDWTQLLTDRIGDETGVVIRHPVRRERIVAIRKVTRVLREGQPVTQQEMEDVTGRFIKSK